MSWSKHSAIILIYLQYESIAFWAQSLINSKSNCCVTLYCYYQCIEFKLYKNSTVIIWIDYHYLLLYFLCHLIFTVKYLICILQLEVLLCNTFFIVICLLKMMKKISFYFCRRLQIQTSVTLFILFNDDLLICNSFSLTSDQNTTDIN